MTVRSAFMGCTNAWAPTVSWLLGSTCCWEALLCVRRGSIRGRSTSSASRRGNQLQKDPRCFPKRPPFAPHILVLIPVVVVGGPGGGAWRTDWFGFSLTYNVLTHTV